MYSKTQSTLNSLNTNDLKTLAREFKFSASGTRETLIKRLLLKGGGKSEDSEVLTQLQLGSLILQC